MKTLKLVAAVVGVAGLAFVTGKVAAADGAALYKAKLCHTCHGEAGAAPIMPVYPKLNGQNPAYTVQQIKDIRDGKRTNGMTAAMKPMVAAVTDEEAQAIADYLAAQ
jgi:cytochrome c553